MTNIKPLQASAIYKVMLPFMNRLAEVFRAMAPRYPALKKDLECMAKSADIYKKLEAVGFDVRALGEPAAYRANQVAAAQAMRRLNLAAKEDPAVAVDLVEAMEIQQEMIQALQKAFGVKTTQDLLSISFDQDKVGKEPSRATVVVKDVDELFKKATERAISRIQQSNNSGRRPKP